MAGKRTDRKGGCRLAASGQAAEVRIGCRSPVRDGGRKKFQPQIHTDAHRCAVPVQLPRLTSHGGAAARLDRSARSICVHLCASVVEILLCLTFANRARTAGEDSSLPEKRPLLAESCPSGVGHAESESRHHRRRAFRPLPTQVGRSPPSGNPGSRHSPPAAADGLGRNLVARAKSTQPTFRRRDSLIGSR